MALGKTVRPRFSRRKPLLRPSMALVVYMTFLPIICNGGRLSVVRYEQAQYTAEVIEGVNMTQQPVLLLHIAAGLRIGVPTAWQHGHKDISRPLFSGNAVCDAQRITSPVHLHGILRLVRVRVVSFVTRARRRYFSQYWVYEYATPPSLRILTQYSSHRRVSVTPFFTSSLCI